jgi:hypothetical protein
MQSHQKVRAIIDAAYARLERATESSTEATKLLRAATDAAVAGEKAHRRMGANFGGTYRASVQTAARYFVCKWYADTSTKVTCALDACMLRADCLNATALREWLVSEGKAVELEGITDLDYSADIVGQS